MNRLRGINESMKRFRTALLNEQYAIDKKLAGRIIWPGEWGTARRVTIKGKPYYANDRHAVCLV